MARIRSIKPEFFTSEQVVECSPTARLLFIGMWCFADDAGVHPASNKRLKMEVFPGDNITEETVGGLVDELVDAGLIERFQSQSKEWLAVTGWHHQKIEKPSYRYPSPPIRQSVADWSSNDRLPVADDQPPESSRVESIGEDVSKGDKSPANQSKRFKPPTIDEVSAYCKERGNSVAPQRFVDFYAAKGWMVGKNGMKDWKAAVRNWEGNNGVGNGRAPPGDDEAKSAAKRAVMQANTAATRQILESSGGKT
jgi:hypothetical protein